MLQPRLIPTWAIIGCGLSLLFIFTYQTSRPFTYYSTELFGLTRPSSPSTHLQRVGNSTLGFEKVFAVGLPERSDKRDALALASRLTGFEIEWIDGVRGEEVPDKALPFGVDRVQLWENNLGSWRGHMNAIRTIVEKGYASALMMEDDMDWDIRIKSQLLQFAQAARYLYPPTPGSSEASPYGDDWDVLWLGHCGEIFPETLPEHKDKPYDDPDLLEMSRKATISPDPTVPTLEHVAGLQNFSAYPQFTRFVHVSGGPICSFAYALSQRGARKVLYDLSVDHLVGPFDNALAGLCRWGRSETVFGMKCLTVSPPLFSHHKAKGYVFGDSDIQSYGGGQKGELRERGFTENMVWSARLNLRNLLMGGEMEPQFG